MSAPEAAARVPLARPEVPGWRLALTLAVAGALAGLLLVFVDRMTRPRIEAHAREVLARAVREILDVDPASGDGSRIESLAVGPSAFTREPEPRWQVNAARIDRVFVGYDGAGAFRGFALVHEGMGFQDKLKLIFGYDPRTKQVLGMRVLESKETPGLGERIEIDAGWVESFAGRRAPLVPVKAGRMQAPEEIDTITGATISSSAVIRILNEALARGRLGERLTAWLAEAGR